MANLWVLPPVLAQTLNGFTLDMPLIPEQEIMAGGPPRDGIPALHEPRFIPVTKASYLEPQNRVLAISHKRKQHAYPIRILDWHEIVNDTIEGDPIVITYCPLCGSGMAFSAMVKGKKLRFGVSGLLYNSDVLLYDLETGSLWSQILGQAINGPLKGTHLQQLPLTHTTWSDWSERYPDSLVLSDDTGFSRNYRRSPYGGYATSERLYFPVKHQDRRYHPKQLVLGITVADTVKAYPFIELSKVKQPLQDTVAEKAITITHDINNNSAVAVDETGAELPSTILYWFAWLAFFPQTEVFQAPAP